MAKLDILTSIEHKTIIDTFVQQIRQMLWYEIIQAQLSLGFIISGSLLFFLGLINITYHAIPLSLCLIIASLPLITTLCIALGRRPDHLAAARFADNNFKGKSLLTTAVELLNQKKSTTESSLYIFQQAARSSLMWQKQWQTTLRYTPKPTTWFFICIAVVGLFLAFQQGKNLTIHRSEAPSYRQEKAPNKSFSRSLLAEIKQSPATNNKTSPPEIEDNALNRKPKQTFSKAPNEAIDISLEDSMTKNTKILSQNKTIPTETKSQHQSANNSVDYQEEQTALPPSPDGDKDMKIKTVDIIISGGTLLSNGKTRTSLDKPIRHRVNNKISFSAKTSKNETPLYPSDFSIVQRQYIETYFNKIQREP